jgi:hypothetical protein
MYLPHYLAKIRQTPPQELPAKARRWLSARQQEIRQHWRAQWRDRYFSTYSPYPPELDQPLYRYLPPYPQETLAHHQTQILALADLYSQHNFECLGSGWVNVRHGVACQGLENHQFPPAQEVRPDPQGQWLKTQINTANLSQSQQIWRLIDPGYTPIDWQLDFKSGYRWSAQTPSPRIRYAHQLGADIKVPWELARTHHLPMLAWAYGSLIQKEPEKARRYQQEYRNQILDFIAANPPRYGVNWVCAMDVGIRVVNWLVAYDLFQALGAVWDRDFERRFKQSVYEHGRHLIRHLEWGETLRSNHYFANIAGLLFIAAYLPRSAETDGWLAFSLQELITETELQFHPDGSNFEASTSYHRLSAEMLLYSALLGANLPDDKRRALEEYQPNPQQTPPLRPRSEQLYDPAIGALLPPQIWERLQKAGQFTGHITKPNGEIAQIGDNDSGRFLKLWPHFAALTPENALAQYANLQPSAIPGAIYWDEQILNHQHLTAAFSVLFNSPETPGINSSLPQTPETTLIQTWLHLKRLSPPIFAKTSRSPITGAVHPHPSKTLDLTQAFTELCQTYGAPHQTVFSAQTRIQEGLTIAAYPDFGLYLYRSPNLFLSVRCGNTGQNGNGGHAHNDQLSIELVLEGRPIIQDPGTYLYTPLPERRNQYRSTKAHFTPQAQPQEQNTWYEGTIGLFSLRTQHKGQCLHFDPEGFLGVHRGFDRPVFRLLRIEPSQIVLYDWGGAPDPYQPPPFSNGYGRIAHFPA